MDTGTLLLLFGTLASIASAVFTFVQARAATETLEKADAAAEKAEAAQAKAEAAQEKANQIAEVAASELARSAKALERANELTEAAIPKPDVSWEISPTGRGDMWRCKNVGTIAARNVSLSGGSGIYTDEDSSAQLVPPGQALEFGVMRAWGLSPQLTISWDDDNTPSGRSESVAIRGH